MNNLRFAKKIMAYSTLFFVGNGFDLAAKYPTSYSNFYNSIYFKKLIDEKNPIALYVESRRKIQNWADLEQELYNFTKDSEADGLNESMEQYFKQVRMNLYLYISSVDKSRPKNNVGTIRNLQRFFDQLYSEDKNIGFISFNYTSIFDNLWEETIKDRPAIQHVHGKVEGFQTLGDNIVLGIDETMEVSIEHDFLYKSYNDSYRTYDILNAIKEAKRIIIFGCSMGESDRWYFENIFRNCTGKILEIIAFGDEEIKRSKRRVVQLSNRKSLATFTAETHLKTFDNSNIGTLLNERMYFYNTQNPELLASVGITPQS